MAAEILDASKRNGAWKGSGWAVDVDSGVVCVRTGSRTTEYKGESVKHLRARRSLLLRWQLCSDKSPLVRLKGLRGSDANELRRALQRASLESQIEVVVGWDATVRSRFAKARNAQRWIPREHLDQLEAARPSPELGVLLSAPGNAVLLTAAERAAVARLGRDLAAEIDQANAHTLAVELRDRREFFDRVEKSPLTEEQARAVVCFDNRVQLVAAAGSGKTSVMVARAAYAVARGFADPSRVLLLAFNSAAAKELQERIVDRFAAAGIPHEGVRASTFHSFGLSVIGKATGRKPRLASWVEQGRDVATVQGIVDELRDGDPMFRYRWDLYRLLFASAPATLTGGSPDSYDSETRATGYSTLDGQTVRSAGERLIADWLFLNGVEYRYEAPFSVNVADETHSQYHPDFYYPAINAWHEHWALDGDGQPPPDFVGYAEGIEWKRRTHHEHGTVLIESTWHDVMFGDGLAKLARDLTERGIVLDWNPDRPMAKYARPIQHGDLARLVRTFMSHVKANSLSGEAILQRAAVGRRRRVPFRTQLFLDLYWPIHREWDRRLSEDGSVDFEDMLVQAADHLEADAADMGYDLILVDEFQDASEARARLVRGLLRRPGRYLLAVGDDWQAINRFAGADISVMLRFEEWFGRGPQLQLTTTFRCPQSICDAASTFVMRNPRQFKKQVRSANTATNEAVRLIRALDAGAALRAYLRRLSSEVADGVVPTGSDGTISVYVLGRYNFDRDVLPQSLPANLRVDFRTAHGSKGLEADYVVVPRLSAGRYGFPSEIADDPVLDLAMAEPDGFPNAEERRLLYVALTRARREATVITEVGRESAFAVELLKDGLAVEVDVKGDPVEPVILCSSCGRGAMVRRTGRYGDFLGCSTFPACRATRPLP